MAFVRQQPPGWFWGVATLLTLWSLIGCFFCVRQFLLGADAMGPADAYQRALYAGLPGWYDYVYAVAVGAGLLGGLALLTRSVQARWLFVLSLVAVIVQFGWLFVTTDLLIARGATTALFPLLIVVIAVYAIWFAAKARRHGWIC